MRRWIAYKYVLVLLGLLEHVTVLIGVCVEGTAVGGVIYQPFYNYKTLPEDQQGRVIWGIMGMG